MIPFSGRRVLIVHAGGPGLMKLKRAAATLGANGFRVAELEMMDESAVSEVIDFCLGSPRPTAGETGESAARRDGAAVPGLLKVDASSSPGAPTKTGGPAPCAHERVAEFHGTAYCGICRARYIEGEGWARRASEGTP